MVKWIRHGDVILEKINEVPKGVFLKRTINPVLAEGEVTGHFHKLTSECMFADRGSEKFVELEMNTELVHDEHDTLVIPKGVYKVFLQREVDLLGQVRQVMD